MSFLYRKIFNHAEYLCENFLLWKISTFKSVKCNKRKMDKLWTASSWAFSPHCRLSSTNRPIELKKLVVALATQSRLASALLDGLGRTSFYFPNETPVMIDRRRYWVTESSRVFFCERQLLWFDFRRLEVFSWLAVVLVHRAWHIC